ncbi:hypothetical protein PO909_018048 [Leuciscus waleckii]
MDGTWGDLHVSYCGLHQNGFGHLHQLCPNTSTSWRGNLHLPSPACKFSSTLADKAYSACGEVVSTLHAMVLLQVYQAKALNELHKGSSEPGVMQELRTATDMSTLVVQGSPAVPTFSIKVQFLSASRAGCFPARLTGSSVPSDSAMRFSSPGALPSSCYVSCLASRDRCPTGEGLGSPAVIKTGFYSPYFIIPKKGSGLLPILDLDSFSTQTVPAVCVRGTGISVQSPALRAVPWHSFHPLKDWLILAQSRDQLCEHRDMVLRHLSLFGPLGQLGQEQTLPCAEYLLSRYVVGLGQPDSATHRGARPVSVELLENNQEQDSSPTETFSEAPGAYGIRSHSNAARIASYETASALASRPNPEMGDSERYVPGARHPTLPPNLHPMVGPSVPPFQL